VKGTGSHFNVSSTSLMLRYGVLNEAPVILGEIGGEVETALEALPSLDRGVSRER